MQRYRAGCIKVNMRFSLNWWKLGPREDWALEEGQWSVCLFESKIKKIKKHYHTQHNV